MTRDDLDSKLKKAEESAAAALAARLLRQSWAVVAESAMQAHIEAVAHAKTAAVAADTDEADCLAAAKGHLDSIRHPAS